MDTAHAQRMLKTARTLRTSLLAIVTQVDDLCDLLEASPGFSPDPSPIEIRVDSHVLRIERDSYSVTWNGRR